MAMPPSGLFSVLTALLAAVIIGANIPDGRDLGEMELESEVSLLSMHETAQGDDGEEYFKIPNFVFNHMAVELEVVDRETCERICNERTKCKSYSYREPTASDAEDAKDETAPKDAEEKAEGVNDAAKNPPEPKGTCAWSTESLHYALGWKFYTKAKDVDWKGNAHLTTDNFHEFDGLEYQESAFQAVEGLELAQCKSKCAQDPKCGAFSYSDDAFTCRLAGLGVHYDRAFSYYEKPHGGGGASTSMSKVDLDMQAKSLSTQEKAAKAAAVQNAGKKKIARDLEAATATKTARSKRMTHERHKKKIATHEAEKRLMDAKRRENHVKDVLAVQTSFQTGYFQNRGQAQESKTKEVKLKAMEIINEEQEQARQLQTKSGEFRAKKQTRAFNQKVMVHKRRIAQTKEKLFKLKNKRLEYALKLQEQGYKKLAINERATVVKIEKGHLEKVKALQSMVRATVAANLKAKKAMKKAQKRSRAQKVEYREADEAMELKGKKTLSELKNSYKAQVRAIIMKGPDGLKKN